MPSLPPCPDEPDEEVLSTRAAAEAHRMVKLCHLAGIVKPCGRGRKLTLRPWAANPNPNPNPNPNQVWRRRAWWISSGCRGAGRQTTARRPVSRQPTARRPVAVVEDNADDDDDAGADDDDDDDDADAQQ